LPAPEQSRDGGKPKSRQRPLPTDLIAALEDQWSRCGDYNGEAEMTNDDEQLRAAKERCWGAMHERFDLLRQDDPENAQIYDIMEQSNRDNMEQQPWRTSPEHWLFHAEDFEKGNGELRQIPVEIRRYVRDPGAAPKHLRDQVSEYLKPRRDEFDVFEILARRGLPGRAGVVNDIDDETPF
jgi:hypothetical protein